MVLVLIPDFANAKLFLDNDKQNIEEKSHIIFPANSLSPEEAIKADVISQNNNDLSTYLSLRTTKVGSPENRNEIMILREKYPEYDILQNTVEARLAGITSIPLTLVESITKIDEYFNLFSEIEAYYVAIDYQLESENQYVYNGVNYRLYLLALEEDQWVIIQISHIPIHRMIEEGYGFGTEGYERLIKAHQIPSTIRVYRSSSGSIDVVDFDYYVKNVLPNEWIGSWPMESLYAGVLACKMYGWYHILYPRSTYYDVRDDTYDQVYAPGSEYYRTNQAVDDMDGIGVERDDGALFETQYLAGTYGPDKPSGEYEGRMSQWRTKYWADQGKNYTFMVHYYWDNSPQAGYQLVNIFGSTVELAPPPEHVYPLNNSTIHTTTPIFEWNSVSTADGYGLYIRDIASSEMVYATGEQPLYGTSLELPGGILENGKSYWWNMNSYNSAGWNPECSIHWKFTVQVDSYPIVNSFSINPTSVTLGDYFDISYSVSDDVSLSWVELWRTNDKNGQPDENGWTQIGPQYSISGKSYSGEFHDSPSLSGIYWYGIHVGDTAGNWSVEPKPPGPIKVTVVSPTRIIRLEGNLNFGDVQVGSSSQRTLIIYNDGNSTLTVYGINCPTGFSDNWSGTISAGGSRNVTITFSPTQAILYSGTLTVNSDATSGNNFRSLSGTGVSSTYPPQVTTNDVSNITSTSAQLNGNLGDTGGLSCQVWFEYGKTTSYGISTTKQSKFSIVPFNETIISLDSNTTYYFKACASNSEGTVYGADKTFTTPMLGDFDGDCQVGFSDLVIFALAYNTTPSDSKWNPICDLNSDGKIDFDDLIIFAMHYGDVCTD